MNHSRVTYIRKGKFISEGIFQKSEQPIFCHFWEEFLNKFLLQYESFLKSFNFNKRNFEKYPGKCKKKVDDQ